MWDAWRKDWATGQFGPVEVAMAVELAWAYEDLVRNPRPSQMAEIRRWMDGLGLTPRGKADLRLRLEDTGPQVIESTEEDRGESPAPGPAPARERYGQLRPVG